MRTLFLSLLVFLSITAIHSSAETCCFQPSLEVKTGYFFFSDSTMQKVYDRGGLDIQLCASYPFWNLSEKWTLNAYEAIEYFQRSGRSINGHQKISLWSIPINIGLKPVYAINSHMRYYFALGPRYLYLRQEGQSSISKSKNALGFFINTGLSYNLCTQFVIDVFGEYSYAKLRFHSENSRIYTRHTQVGGFTFGGGLGYEF